MAGGAIDLPLRADDTSFNVSQITPQQLVVHLRAGGSDCTAGVYPVRLTLVDTGSGATIGSLTTHLVYVTSAAPNQELQVATVLPLSMKVRPSHNPSPADLVGSPYRAALRYSPSTMDAIDRTVSVINTASNASATVNISGQTVLALNANNHQATVSALSQLSGSGRDQVLSSPFTPVDATRLVDAGLGSELTAQVLRGSQLLNQSLIARTPGPSGSDPAGGAWIADANLDDATLAELASAGYQQLIVPSSDVTSSPATGSSAEPFTIDSPHGSSFTVLASDAGLAGRFDASSRDPVLAASHIIAQLAQIYFEYPNGTQPRVVVVAAPSSWTPNPTLVATLLRALGSSQILKAVTVSAAFHSFAGPVSCAGGCRLASSPNSSTPPPVGIRAQRARIASLGSAIGRGSPAVRSVTTELGDLVLASEAEGLKPNERATLLANARAALESQAHQIALAGASTVTLAARQGQIPVTIDKASGIPGPVTGILTLTSDRLVFANGQGRISLPETLNRPTNNFEINVQARTSGEFKLGVSFEAPSGGLQLATGQVTVRSDAFSLVGVLLSLGAVVVLGAWWIRTSLRRRRIAVHDAAGTHD